MGYYFPQNMSFVIHYSENKFFISCNFDWYQKVYRLLHSCNWSRITIDLPIISQTFILSLSLLNSARPASFTFIIPKSPYFVWKRLNPPSNEIVLMLQEKRVMCDNMYGSFYLVLWTIFNIIHITTAGKGNRWKTITVNQKLIQMSYACVNIYVEVVNGVEPLRLHQQNLWNKCKPRSVSICSHFHNPLKMDHRKKIQTQCILFCSSDHNKNCDLAL